MSFLRPVAMAKVAVVGLKDDRDRILSILYDGGVAQVEPVGKEALEVLEPERASDVQRAVGDELVRFRGLKAALPPMPSAAPRQFEDQSAVLNAAKAVPIDEEVGSLKREEDALLTRRKALTDDLDLFRRFRFYPDRLELLSAKSALAFFGEAHADVFSTLRSELPALSDAMFLDSVEGTSVRFIVAVRAEQAEAVSRLAQQRGVTLIAAPRYEGPIGEVVPKVTADLAQVDARLAEIRARLSAIARAWYPAVASIEEALSIESRKLDIYTRLAAGRSTFTLEAWIPRRHVAQVEQQLVGATQGRALLYEIGSPEEPPTLMDNPPGVRRFEFFIRFYSLPTSSEFDPTFVFAVVFPIFFGLMLGDWGYGLVILTISLWMIAGFPGGRHVPSFLRSFLKRIMGPSSMRSLAYALVPGCVVAIGAGLLFNEFFGYHLLPTPYLDAASKTGASQLLLLTGYIGLAMVSFGFLLGALKEYYHHKFRHAIGKVGGILFAVGVAFFGLGVIRHQISLPLSPLSALILGTLATGAVTMVVALGFQEGGLGLIEVVSHILSYTRLLGILLASVILTVVAFTVAGLLYPSHGIGGLIAGALIVVLIETFNIVLGVFEPGIQGARLIFVEYFSKFYGGNGKEFKPFGAARTHTTPSAPLPAAPARH
ncbi:MAG: V-type ATP synthase subunit I [Thermoplasmata archaeon]|nr:V-type ATP synthase subunit I [Thermoplasmata archaeon]